MSFINHVKTGLANNSTAYVFAFVYNLRANQSESSKVASRIVTLVVSLICSPITQTIELIEKAIFFPFSLVGLFFTILKGERSEFLENYFKSFVITLITTPLFLLVAPFAVIQLFLPDKLPIISYKIIEKLAAYTPHMTSYQLTTLEWALTNAGKPASSKDGGII